MGGACEFQRRLLVCGGSSSRVHDDQLARGSTTRNVNAWLLKYTENLAIQHIAPEQLRRVHVGRVHFNYETRRWQAGHFTLPWRDGD